MVSHPLYDQHLSHQVLWELVRFDRDILIHLLLVILLCLTCCDDDKQINLEHGLVVEIIIIRLFVRHHHCDCVVRPVVVIHNHFYHLVLLIVHYVAMELSQDFLLHLLRHHPFILLSIVGIVYDLRLLIYQRVQHTKQQARLQVSVMFE